MDIIKTVKEITNKYSRHDMDFDELLVDSGIDSLNFIELIVELENEFNIEFDPSKLTYQHLKTIRVISENIEELLQVKDEK